MATSVALFFYLGKSLNSIQSIAIQSFGEVLDVFSMTIRLFLLMLGMLKVNSLQLLNIPSAGEPWGRDKRPLCTTLPLMVILAE